MSVMLTISRLNAYVSSPMHHLTGESSLPVHTARFTLVHLNSVLNTLHIISSEKNMFENRITVEMLQQ